MRVDRVACSRSTGGVVVGRKKCFNMKAAFLPARQLCNNHAVITIIVP